MGRLSLTERDGLLVRLDTRTEKLPGIEKHLKELNGSINETNLKLAATETIAKSAEKKADGNRSYIDKLTIALIAAVITGMASVTMAAMQIMGG